MLKQSLKLFFILLGFSVIAVWISNNYGTVDIFWLGYSIHTSVPVLLFVMWIVFICVDKTMSVLSFLLKPFKKKRKKKEKQKTNDDTSLNENKENIEPIIIDKNK